MAFQYKESDKRGNPKLFKVDGGWVTQYEYYSSTDKVSKAIEFCDYMNSIFGRMK